MVYHWVSGLEAIKAPQMPMLVGAAAIGAGFFVVGIPFAGLLGTWFSSARIAEVERLIVKLQRRDVKDKKTRVPVIDPETGEVKKREASNRRAGYDFTFSSPKSVSVYLAVNEDKLVEQMITEAVDETMSAMEAGMETKVRKG